MIGKISLSEHETAIEEHGYISVCEPCCGAGAMLLGFAGAMIERGYSTNRHMLVTAADIDLVCVHMCYIQLSLYGIPAIVIHGNSLTNQVWSQWQTPLYIVGCWSERQSVMRPLPTTEVADEAVPATVIASVEFDITLLENENGQIEFDLGGF
jgi:hypothetical protein